MVKSGRDSATAQQNLIIMLSFFVYASAYVGRYSFSSSINSFIDRYGIGKSETGLVMTFFFVAYGIGQVINGFLCKYYPKRYIFPVALFISSIINLVLFIGIETGYVGDYFYLVKYIWALNGMGQSLIWTSIVYTLGENIEQKNLPRSGLVIGLTVPVGTFVAYSMSSLTVHFGHFELSFVLAAVIMSAVGVIWLMLFKPYQRTDIKPDTETEKETGKKSGSKMPAYILITVIGLSVFAIANNFIKDGLQTWIPTILKDTYSFSASASLMLAMSIYILGVCGTILVKKIHNYISDFVILCVIFFSVMSALIGGIRIFLNVSAVPVTVLFGAVIIGGYAVNNIVTSIAPLFLRDYLNPGISAGILDGFCYIGSAITTYALGAVVENSKGGEWGTAIMLLLTVSVFSTVTALLLKLIKVKKSEV